MISSRSKNQDSYQQIFTKYDVTMRKKLLSLKLHKILHQEEYQVPKKLTLKNPLFVPENPHHRLITQRQHSKQRCLPPLFGSRSHKSLTNTSDPIFEQVPLINIHTFRR